MGRNRIDSLYVDLKSALRNFKSAILLCALLLALCLPAEAQQPGKIPRIGLLISASNVVRPFTDALRQGMRDLGYVEGKTYVLEIRGGGAEPYPLTDLAAELVSLKVDIIVAAGGQALLAAKKATSAIPVVMRIGGDPIRAGHVASLARPGGNITGVYAMSVELSGKRLEILAEVVPGLKRIAVLTTTSKFAATDEYKDMEAAARVLGAKLQILTPLDPDTIDRAFLAIGKERAQALVVMPNPRYTQHREHIFKHVTKNRLPSIYSHSQYVENGGLMSYGVNVTDEYRHTAIYVDKILKGAKPADLPIEQPTKFEFVINLKAAKQIGLIIPPNILARANKVIR
jgi:putative tryptophan/tyrosine transport system substrate-binding protein